MTEQIIYSELEAYAVRWPYLKTEPIDARINQTTAKTFNVGASSEFVGGGNYPSKIYGSRRFGMVLKTAQPLIKLTSVQAYLLKAGSPPDLKVQLWSVKKSGVYENACCWAYGQPSVNRLDVYGGYWHGETFKPVSNRELVGGYVWIVKIGSPPDLVIEVQEAPNDTPNGVVVTSVTIPASQIPTTIQWVRFDFTSKPTLDPTKKYAVILHTQNNGGDANNKYQSAFTGDEYKDGVRLYSSDGGASWTTSVYDLGIVTLQYDDRYVLGSLLEEITYPASNIGTIYSWATFTFSNNIALTPDDAIAVVLYTNGGDASNYYEWRNSSGIPEDLTASHSANGNTELHSLESVDDGSSWSYYYRDLWTRLNGDIYARLYEGYYDYPEWRSATPSGEAEIELKANTGTVKVILVIGTSSSNEYSTTSTTPVKMNIPAGEAKASGMGRQRWIIGANGDGATEDADGDGVVAWFRPAVKYEKNPVTPRDFFFSEMYLLRVKAEQPNTIVRLNDSTSILLANAGDLFEVGEAFRTPVKKLQVLDGQATCDMLGVI